MEDLMFVNDGTDGEWIVDGLIRPGDQVLLAGAPKAGKSLLALQLALMVALGGKVPPSGKRDVLFAQSRFTPEHDSDERKPIEVKKARRVLYLSFEMGERSVSSRLRKQLKGLGFDLPSEDSNVLSAELLELPLYHVFSLPPVAKDKQPRRSLRLVVPSGNHGGQPSFELGPDFEDLRKHIRAQKPDLVVLDTLIQTHQLNENSNVEMKAVMQAIRDACVRPSDKEPVEDEHVAHVIVHHMRKDNGQTYNSSGAESMRGAGSIHSEAELALLLHRRSHGAELSGSARDISVDELVLTLDKSSLLFSAELKDLLKSSYQVYIATVFHRLLATPEMNSAEGMTRDDAVLWLEKHGKAIADEVGWKSDASISRRRVSDCFDRLATESVVEVVPGAEKGGKHVKKHYRTIAGLTIDRCNDALPPMQFHSKRRSAQKRDPETVTAGEPTASSVQIGTPAT